MNLPQAHIDDQAIAWHVRLKDPSASAEDLRQFSDWHDAAPAHAEAYARAQALWQEMESPARQLGRGGWYRQTGRHWITWLRPAAVAATIALIASAMTWRDPGMVQRLTADLSTPPGIMHETVLADGSTVLMDRDSAADVDVAGRIRHVKLLRGRAWFDVAADGKAFIVSVNDVEVQVLGTAFSVDSRNNTIRVAVERGQVAVTRLTDGQTVILDPGQMVSAGPSGPLPPIGPFDIGTDFAWRRNLVVFDRATIAEVAAQIEHLRSGRIIVADSDLGAKTLSGVFNADSPDAILSALQSGFGVSTTTLPGIGTIIHR